MFARLRKLTGWSLLAFYGGLALLGHAGMHEFHGDHAHTHDAVAARSAAQPHSHSHSGCCHHHAHSTGAQDDGSQPGHEHNHHPHGPSHDHDNCLICQHFAAKAFVFAPPVLPGLSVNHEQTRCASSRPVIGADLYVLPIRGPPSRAC